MSLYLRGEGKYQTQYDRLIHKLKLTEDLLGDHDFFRAAAYLYTSWSLIAQDVRVSWVQIQGLEISKQEMIFFQQSSDLIYNSPNEFMDMVLEKISGKKKVEKVKSSKVDYFSKLAKDLILEIGLYLDYRELTRLFLTTKRFGQIFGFDTNFWEKKIKIDFPWKNFRLILNSNMSKEEHALRKSQLQKYYAVLYIKSFLEGDFSEELPEVKRDPEMKRLTGNLNSIEFVELQLGRFKKGFSSEKSQLVSSHREKYNLLLGGLICLKEKLEKRKIIAEDRTYHDFPVQKSDLEKIYNHLRELTRGEIEKLIQYLTSEDYISNVEIDNGTLIGFRDLKIRSKNQLPNILIGFKRPALDEYIYFYYRTYLRESGKAEMVRSIHSWFEKDIINLYDLPFKAELE